MSSLDSERLEQEAEILVSIGFVDTSTFIDGLSTVWTFKKNLNDFIPLKIM